MIAFHSWYDRFVPEVGIAAGSSPLLLTLKFQKSFANQRFVDMLLADDAGTLHGLPFVMLHADGLIFPRRAKDLGENLLAALSRAVNEWRIQKLNAETPSIDVLTDDASILQLAEPAMAGNYSIPALSAHGVLLTDHDRYAVATRYLHGRAILDLNPRSGYALSIMRRINQINGDWSRDPVGLQLAQRFGLASDHHSKRYDGVVALNVPPEDVEPFVERAIQSTGRGGRIVISTSGELGAATLRERGFDVIQLQRPGLGHALESEWIGTRNGCKLVWHGNASGTPATVCERPLRIAFMVRSSAGESGGWGDIIQVRRTAAALHARGHRVDILSVAGTPAADYDVVHLTRLTGESETLAQARGVRDFSGPVCLMPIFNDHAAETVWGMQAAMIALWEASDDNAVARNLSLLKSRSIQFTDGHGRIILPPPARNELTPGSLETEREILRYVDFLIANAYGEVRAIFRHVDCTLPFAVVPTSTDTTLYQPSAKDAFVDKYGLKDFVLATGRMESRKNQVLLMEALAASPELPLVLIGGSVVDQYPTLLRARWAQNTILFPNLPEEELAGAYAAARVVALPSWDEVASLSSLNAAACGASLVLSRNGFELEYFRDDAEYCDPADTQSIAAAVERAWSTHGQRAQRREELRERVAREYSWDRTAELTEAAYYRALAFNPRGELRRSRAHV